MIVNLLSHALALPKTGRDWHEAYRVACEPLFFSGYRILSIFGRRSPFCPPVTEQEYGDLSDLTLKHFFFILHGESESSLENGDGIHAVEEEARNFIALGNVDLFSTLSVDLSYITMLYAAANILYLQLSFQGKCRVTFLSLYAEVLMFKTPLPGVCASVRKRPNPAEA